MKIHLNISFLAVAGLLWTGSALAIDVAPETLDCETPAESVAPVGPETSEERTARLNMEFEQSLQYFDRCIAKITQDDYMNASSGASGAMASGGGAASGAGGAQASSDGGEASESGENTDGADSTAQASADTSSGSEGEGAPELGQSASAKSTIEGSGSGAVPSDIPGGDDDDIVAQQLRQAAMETTDPTARERLWDDYRKYKGIEK